MRLEFSGLGIVWNGNFDGVRTYGAARLGSLWSLAAVFTDRDGRFAVRGFDGRQNVGFDVRDQRFAMQGVTIPASVSTTEVTKVLAPAQTIEGTVRAEDTGQPLPHARLAIHAGQSAASGFMGMTAATDANGHFSVNPWSGNYFMVLAYPPDGTPYLIVQENIKWSKGAVRTRLDLHLPRGVLVRGKITEAASGRPIKQAGPLH